MPPGRLAVNVEHRLSDHRVGTGECGVVGSVTLLQF
ncbi:hypothetical protein SAMN05444166_3300 [Singulisphaera sp. GP187]|nr:hypothetical protein SAMN05444166_3300 [Singulisphaera sp. GP187]